MFFTIDLILLLFALGSSAHTLSRIQITNGSDIYEIREKPNNMFEIIDAKPKKPTLREIIFFKIIERPYKDHSEKEKSSQEQGPDFDDSERPFTNGPGFQFLDFGPINVHKSSEDDKNSKNDGNSKGDKDGSKNDSKESNNENSGSNESNIDSHENNNDSKESKNDSNSGSSENRSDSKESKNGSNSGSNENKNDSQENKNDSKESKNDSNDSNSGSNENKNDSQEKKNDSKESKNDRNDSNSSSNESKNNNNGNKNDSKESNTDNNKNYNDKVISDSSNADKKDDNRDKDNENKENDSKQSSESKNINKNNDNISPDISQTTELAAPVTKIEAAILERNKQFDEAKEKYQEINKKNDNSTKLLRRKRNIDFSMPPPPPVLSPLNVGMLPDFIQRMISNVPALKNMVSPDERSESNYQDESRPRTYGFHLNNDKGRVWNHLPFVDQDNYINEPSVMINKDKKEEYHENNSPDSSSGVSSSGSDDNSLNSDNDSGYSAPEDRSSDDDSIGGYWPQINAPLIDLNNLKPYNPITKEKDSDNLVDNSEQHEPIKPTTETYINYHQTQNLHNSEDEEPKATQKTTPLPKTKININKDLKEKIEMSFDNLGKIVPPLITRFEEKLVKTAVDNNEPKTFGMKLNGNNGYVWNDLASPGNHYIIGEALDKMKEWNEPSSPATDHFNEYNTEPTTADESATKANERTDSPLHENERPSQSSIENKTQEPTTESGNLNEPNKESLDKDKNNADEKKDNEGVEVALDDLLKKDEFWQWLTKWTAAYIEVLNEHVEELVKREVAKQFNKTMNHKIEEEKDKIDANNTALNNKNETVANVTTEGSANKTNEINTNITTTEKSIPEINNTAVNLAPETDKIKAMNKTGSEGHKSNKTTPANGHTIYGNAIDSDHVTNIFIFYPNAENNATAKDIEAILGKTNNNVVVLGTPSNDNKDSKADSSTNNPFHDTTGIYAIDKKKDMVPNTSELTSETPETTTSNKSSTTDIPSKEEPTTETTAKTEDTTATTKTDTSDTSEATTSSDTGSTANATTDAVSSNTESTISNTETTTPTLDTTTVVPDTTTAS